MSKQVVSQFLKIFTILALILITNAGPKRSGEFDKIVGGHTADPHQFPYNIQLQWWGNHYCGGAIIAPQWIITAAHCAIQEAISYNVIANQYNLLVPEEERRYQVTKLFQHPEYIPGKYVFDIALMKVGTPILFDEFVQPVALPPANHTTPEGSFVSITGWGAMAEDGLSSPYLRWVDIPVVSRENCQTMYAEVGLRVDENMMCAGYVTGGHDSCSGDSGGPVVAQDLGYQYITGVVSWAVGCARPNFPGVNSEVSFHIDWLMKIMNEN